MTGRGATPAGRVALIPLLLAAAAGLCTPAHAQGVRALTGVVLNGADSTPVVGAYVEITGTTLHLRTDADGRFVFEHPPAGALALRVARIGFLPAAIHVSPDSAAPAVTVVLIPAPIEVSPVVVTASRETHLAEDAPTSVSVATSEDIEHRATIGVDEAIALVPGVQLLDGQINIRGSSGYAKGLGSRVLLLIDGVPANQGDRGGINWDLLPVTEVERVEVLKGTGSALYGSAALGGVVNVITRDIPDEPQYSARLFSGAYADAPPLWQWRAGRALFGGADLGMSRKLGPLRLLVSGGAVGNQGYRENNGDRRSHALAKLEFEPGTSLRAELYAAAVHENEGNVTFWCEQGQCVDRGLTYQPFRVDSTTLGDRLLSDKYQVQATARRILGPVLALDARVSWFRTTFKDHFRADSNGSTADRFGAELGAEWHPSAGRVVNLGTEETYSTVTSDLFGDHSQTELAWFAESETQFGDRVHVSLGARLDAIAVDAVGWDAVGSPRFAITWQLPGIRLRASVGRGFRAPSLAERFTSTEEQGVRVIPNPNLGNETSWAGETGATVRLDERIELDGALFWNEYQNLIEPGLVSGGTQIQFANVTRARVRGVDVTARAAALAGGHLSGELAYTYLDARDLTLDLPLAFRPQHLATLSADWQVGRPNARGDGVSAGFDAHIASSPQRVEIYESDRRVPQRTLDLRATWRRGGFEIVGKVENVFNYIYTLVPRTLEPPRTYSLSLTTTW